MNYDRFERAWLIVAAVALAAALALLVPMFERRLSPIWISSLVIIASSCTIVSSIHHSRRRNGNT